MHEAENGRRWSDVDHAGAGDFDLHWSIVEPKGKFPMSIEHFATFWKANAVQDIPGVLKRSSPPGSTLI